MDLHVNQKSDYDDDWEKTLLKQDGKCLINVNFIMINRMQSHLKIFFFNPGAVIVICHCMVLWVKK